jgi:pimeloyl-ACP methyl ester carboxylesterase
MALLDEALDLWRGTPLGEFLDHDFARLESTRLAELRLDAGEERAELLLRLDRPVEAVAGLEELFADAPGRERVCTRLMTALYRSGRQADALARYQAHRRFLAEELGLEPSPALRALERAVLDHALDPAEPMGSDTARSWSPYRFDARIAYTAVAGGSLAWAWAGAGDGPPLVVVPAWVSNIRDVAAGEEPRSALVAALTRRHRVIIYDRLGTGLSRGGGTTTDVTVDAGAGELVALLDHLAAGPVALLACSQAGPVAVAASADRRDLVSHLVLLGTYADGPAAFPDRDVTEAMVRLVRAHWGIASKALADMFMPGAAAADLDLLAGGQRRAAAAETAAELLEAVYTADVSHLLGRIDVPALVLHYSDDRAIPFVGAEQLASGLPRAELVALSGRHHLPPAEDVDRIAEIMDEFLRRPVRA